MADSGFVKVAEVGDLSPGEMKQVQVGQENLLLANVGGSFYVIGETCTHAGGVLSQGQLDGERVECPRHRAIFSVITGEALSPPADEGVDAYEVRVSGQDILMGPAKS
jgi:nitrite reductase/ring-hydroxylating ferredoxin subunit